MNKETKTDGESPSRTMEYVENLNPQMCKANPDTLIVFGDNLIQKGKRGQACIRDEPNSYGIPTKRLPSMAKGSFFSDKAEEIQAVKDKIQTLKQSNKRIILPKNKIGSGLAKLKTYSPQIAQLIDEELYNTDTPTKADKPQWTRTPKMKKRHQSPPPKQTQPPKNKDTEDLADRYNISQREGCNPSDVPSCFSCGLVMSLGYAKKSGIGLCSSCCIGLYGTTSVSRILSVVGHKRELILMEAYKYDSNYLWDGEHEDKVCEQLNYMFPKYSGEYNPDGLDSPKSAYVAWLEDTKAWGLINKLDRGGIPYHEAVKVLSWLE